MEALDQYKQKGYVQKLKTDITPNFMGSGVQDFVTLLYISDILPRGINTQSQREKVERLSRGAFGKLSFNPKHFPPEDGDADPKRMLLVYEGDETRGGPPGRLHRAFVKHDEHGVTREIELHRNFDIFESGPASTKL
ncbi:hypothetical protein F5887DRAFT_1081767 [Amanita rubescens]|nr:hypothetical protein F5887DRAFT_1081767 [Amanita rubescens]